MANLLKPMSEFEIEEIDREKLQERVDYILSISTKNEDGSIDVNGDVLLDYMNLKKQK